MSNVTDETLLRYCETLYDKLSETAKKDKATQVVLWEGKIVECYSAIGVSNSHYAKIMSTLYEMGSVEQMRRGARGVSTVLALHHRPTLEAVQAASQSGGSRLTNPTVHDKLSQRVGVLEGRLQGIDIKQVIASFNTRIADLEAKLKSK